MNNFQCPNCNKFFSSSLGLAGHKRMHGPSNGEITKIYCSCIITQKVIQVQNLAKYQKSLKSCKHCSKLFKPNGKQYYCNHSCAASATNLARNSDVYGKISKSLIKLSENNKLSQVPKETIIVGPYTKMFLCSCKHCNLKFIGRIKKQYCDDHRDRYSVSAKQGYKFTFNVYKYPTLFDISLIEKYGWFSPGGKAGKWNPNGISRDHKISVTEAIKNNYDPFYITHPLNCELMHHSENNKKKTKSSITFDKLKQLIDDYENGSPDKDRTCVPFLTDYNALTVRPHTSLSTGE